MLSHLLIKNYTLIEHTELMPDVSLNTITGETGAGKSIILGALGLLMGNRADTKVLYNAADKCVIEGTFDVKGYVIEHLFEEEELDYSNTCLIRREISPSGKSRAFVNDTPVNLESLRKITNHLMDVHSQHDTQLLGTNEYQLQIIDTYAQNEKELRNYRETYKQYREAAQRLEQIKSEAAQIRKEFDFNQFLYEELAKAKFEISEQETLENELIILENATEIREKLQLVHEYLNNPEQSALEMLKSAIGYLNQLKKLSPQFGSLHERTQSCYIELKDLANEIETEQDNVEIDPERATKIRERLNLLYHLQQKHQVRNITDLLEVQHDLEIKVSKVLNLDDDLKNAQKVLDKAFAAMSKTAQQLTKSRKNVLGLIENEVKGLLKELGMPNAILKINDDEIPPTIDGTDKIDFWFSANKGIAPQQLKNVASGGEFSRLMMVIKYILASKRCLPTIIFDEIDTGVSGEIAIKMGQMMRDMARSHQIISITHLHQIAAQGSSHYFVYKDHSADKTVSKIRKLSFEERVAEIAQMIAGRKPSEAILQNAREMLIQQLSSSQKSQTTLF
jgi:DNA repair protein RecN (Recombination protein N)